MKNEDIYNLVANIKPIDSVEKQHQEEVLEWIRSGVEIRRQKKPATPPKHLVSYSVLFDPKTRSLLLVDHKKAQRWLPPGGHVDPGEQPLDTAYRELREELNIEGILVDPVPLFLTVTETVGLTAGHVDVSLWYVFLADSSETYSYDSSEFGSIQWFSMGALPLDHTDPHMERFCDKLRLSFSESLQCVAAEEARCALLRES